ncbi:sensor histidine kinase [Marinigracilibium pacificum]|uniref:Histidine kinase n=1 Tax=Marinigracilibium pacificum TaxID=2729599 RepID=A0A848IXY2_9BACT|nr:histidine kinase [Marinigracilibium pacificum]NMM47140.1 histidine kinase [Marinigracilibium pacificum]
MKKTLIYWLCQSIWIVFAFFQIIGYYLTLNDITLPAAFSYISFAVYGIIVTHIYRFIIIKYGWLNLPISKILPRVFLSTFIMSVVGYLWGLGTVHIASIYDASNDVTIPTFIANILVNEFLFLIWSLIYFSYHYISNYRANLKYQAYINEVRLNQLKSQLNPHFIFNGLNSIRALIDIEPDKSKLALTKLSNILRKSLIFDSKKLIDLREEIKTVTDYLYLEKIRYEERLNFNIEIEKEAENIPVPPMMVQTLVENGIKHGISNLINGGCISIKAFKKNTHLILEIINSGQLPKYPVTRAKGHGLANTRERLDLLYSGKATFKIANYGEDKVITSIKLPL